MREILFRGKRVDNGEWVEGFFWKDIWGDGESCYIHYDTEDYQVDPTTVGQYTGLQDKNRNKIFEGDIFCYPKSSKRRFVVEWDECGGFTIFTDSIGFSPEEVEIIGNIHDNHELLEVRT